VGKGEKVDNGEGAQHAAPSHDFAQDSVHISL
jgi:hypothetical protein